MRVFPFFIVASVITMVAAIPLGEHGKAFVIASLVSLGVSGVCALFDFTVEITRA